jgi:hypothetical protein
MSIEEQKQVKIKYYNEAIRYMDNAKKTLKEAGKDNDYYIDDKYVKTACGTAYNGVLKALEGYFILKQVPPQTKGSRKDRQYYEKAITKLDKKLLKSFETVYFVLHLNGYYEGVTNVSIIQDGLKVAYTIIEKIKP